MKIIFGRLLLLPAAACLFLAGCATPVLVDYEEGTDFSGYRTFAVESREERQARRDVVLSPIVDRRVERALGAELEARGLRATTTSPDLRVYYHTVTKTRTRVSSWDIGAGYWGRHYYGGYAGRPVTDIDQYEEGTFIIDLVDTRAKQLVWRGASAERLGWDAPTQAEVDAVVARILARYPPAAQPAR